MGPVGRDIPCGREILGGCVPRMAEAASFGKFGTNCGLMIIRTLFCISWRDRTDSFMMCAQRLLALVNLARQVLDNSRRRELSRAVSVARRGEVARRSGSVLDFESPGMQLSGLTQAPCPMTSNSRRTMIMYYFCSAFSKAGMLCQCIRGVTTLKSEKGLPKLLSTIRSD